MMARFLAALAWLCLLAGLSGCAIGTPTPSRQDAASEAAWLNRSVEISAIDRWLLQARIATSRVGWSGSLRWRQDQQQFDIRVSGPLGTGSFHAQGYPGRVEIRTARESLVTEDPQALLREKAGWDLPLHQLRYWAVGVPYPNTPAIVQLDAVGRLMALEQDGWRLKYDEYGFFEHYELPRRFNLDNGDTTFRVVVDDWSEIS